MERRSWNVWEVERDGEDRAFLSSPQLGRMRDEEGGSDRGGAVIAAPAKIPVGAAADRSQATQGSSELRKLAFTVEEGEDRYTNN